MPNMEHNRIQASQRAIASFCKQSRIRKLSVFGSALRDDFSEHSDLDVLVEFEPGVRVGLIRFAAIEAALSDLLGRKVDLNTPGFLSKHFKDQVLSEAEVQYVAS